MINKKRALIVEFDEGLRLLLEKIFKGRAFDVTSADSIEGLSDILEHETFDVVVINWTEAWSPSRALLPTVCSKYRDTVFVVSRLSGNLELAVELLKAGACDCLIEPVGLADLVDAAEKAMKGRIQAVRPWYDQSVMAIAAAIGLRDVETEEHCHRVASTTVRLVSALGLTQDKYLQSTRWGAFLHDVGKVAIPDSILHKNGPLTADEKNQMRRHPEIGRALLEKIPFLTDSIPLVLHHHERYDGQGYPDGLKGEAIPIEARAIAVADTVDAMLSNRPYRPAMSWREVLAELSENSGGQFDPYVVDVAIRCQGDIFQAYHSSVCEQAALC